MAFRGSTLSLHSAPMITNPSTRHASLANWPPTVFAKPIENIQRYRFRAIATEVKLIVANSHTGNSRSIGLAEFERAAAWILGDFYIPIAIPFPARVHKPVTAATRSVQLHLQDAVPHGHGSEWWERNKGQVAVAFGL
ncbi:hypothetical protein E4U22_004076 [Claviceps purpurea]|nr:hypothetical protein E4U22_004076 [Claviceps purpurea]